MYCKRVAPYTTSNTSLAYTRALYRLQRALTSAAVYLKQRYRRRRNEFPTTNKLLVAIAAAAMTGLMMPSAARGTASRL